LWGYCRGKQLTTPQKQHAAFLATFGNSANVRLEDIFAVGHYVEYFNGHLNDVQRLFKNMKHAQWTQHQIVVERCSAEERVGNQFPLGVKTMYKAYHAVR
jgi:hypothetical protein